MVDDVGCEQQQLQLLQATHNRLNELCSTFSELEHLLPLMLRKVMSFADSWGMLYGAQSLQHLQRTVLQGGDGPASTSVEVCPGVHMQAEILHTDKLFVDVGLGFSVECAYEDAVRIAQLRQAHAQVCAWRGSYRLQGCNGRSAVCSAPWCICRGGCRSALRNQSASRRQSKAG